MLFSIRQKIIFYTVIPVTLLYNLIFGVNLYQSVKLTTADVEERMEEAALHYASKLDSCLVEIAQSARMTGAMVEAQQEFEVQETYQFLRAIMNMNPSVSAMGILFCDRRQDVGAGVVTAPWVDRREGVLESQDLTLTRAEIINKLKALAFQPEEKSWTVDIDSSPYSQTPNITYAHTFIYAENQLGVVVVQVPLVVLRASVAQKVESDIHFALLSSQGRIVDSSSNWGLMRNACNFDDVGDDGMWASLIYNLRRGKIFHIRQYDKEEKEYWLFAAPVKVNSWVLLTGIPKEQALAPAKHQAKVAALVMLGSLLLIVVCVWNLSGLLTRPLRQLTGAVRDFTEGRPLPRLYTQGSDEAGTLSRTFLDMVERLEERDHALHEARARNLGRIAEGLRGQYFYFACDPLGKLIHVSPSLEGILGFTPEEYVRQNIVFPAIGGRSQTEGRQRSSAYEFEVRHKDSSLRRIEFFTVPVKDSRGLVSSLEGMGHDITDRVNDSDKFHSLLEASPDAMVICSPSGGITMVNTRTEDLFDYPRKSLIGQPVMMLSPTRLYKKHPVFQGQDGQSVIAETHGFEFTGLCRQGREFPVEITINPIQTEAGMQIACAIRDISDRKRADVALKQSEERYRRLIEGLQQAYFFYSHDLQGRYSYVTPSVQRIMGYSQDIYMSRARTFLTDNPLNRTVYKNSQAIARGERCPAYQCEMLHADGSKRILEVFEVAAHDANQKITAIEGIARDVTVYKQAELEIRKARDEAESANHAKSQFLSNMSHELRTPLNGVLGYTQILLQDDQVSVGQRENLQAIESCGQHLLTLINDILDLTKIESGGLELNWEIADLRHTLQSVHRMLKARADNKGLSLGLDVTSELPGVLYTDETKLCQILINLVGNAIKYTLEGKVTLSVWVGQSRLSDSVPERDSLFLKVEDTGVGIHQKDLNVIFDPFRQLSTARKEGGTGLGLAISLRLVEALGGHMDVNSKLGEGSSFIFEHPIYPVPESAPRVSLNKPLSGSKNLILPTDCRPEILVVDDSMINRDILLKLLAGAGFNVTEAVGGGEALERLQRQRFDLVLLDIRMPDISGIDVVREIRQVMKLDLPVVAVTASVNEKLQHHHQDMGFNGYICKPFRAEELLEVIADLLHINYEHRELNSEIEQHGTLQRADTEILPPNWLDTLAQAVGMGDLDVVRLAAESARQQGFIEEADRIQHLCRNVDMDQLETFYLFLREKYISL